jgi:hypothetical protein
MVEMAKFVKKFIAPQQSASALHPLPYKGINKPLSQFGTRSNSFITPTIMRNKTPIRGNKSELNRSISANRSQAQNQP